MNIGRAWMLLPALVWLPVTRAQTNLPLNTATSVSRQITVHAPGPTLPAAIAVWAERLKRDWLNRLDLTDTWRDPIVIVIHSNPATNPTPSLRPLRILQIGPVVRYEIAGAVPPPLDERDFAAQVVQALCAELANRPRPAGPVTNWQFATAPVWLAYGLSEALRGQSEWLAAVARRAAHSARPPSAAGILNGTSLPDDEAGRELFVANAWWLAESLLRLPGGVQKFRRLLGELPWSGSFAAAFDRVYGDRFPDAVALEKWWIQQQARLVAIVVPQNLTAAATAERLDELMIYPSGHRFDALERFAERKWVKDALPGRVVDFQNLYARAHPLYQPVIAEYLAAAEHLGAERVSRYRRAVQHAEKLRREADRQAAAIRAAMDHAERAYRGAATTNQWQRMLQPLEQSEKFQQQRRNPISDYLDQFDR
jgi:hypothetical protein